MSRPGQSERDANTFLKSLFSNYYRQANLELPADMDRREFAFQYLGSHSYHRHLSFRDEKSLRAHLVNKAPAHAYYSSALFLLPQVPSMEEKKWLGSDLIFDIDADDIPGCGNREKTFVCTRCGHVFRGAGVTACPRCGGKELVEADTVDKDCMTLALNQLRLLIDVITRDLGLSMKGAYFSGSRGYHLHVKCDEKCRSMTSEERREIVDYLKGVGLDVGRLLTLGTQARNMKNLLVPQPGDPGWRGRLGRVIVEKHGRLPPLTTLGELQEKINGPLDWDLYVGHATIHVDEKVTIDVHRLVRIPGSINGKTGMTVIRVNPEKDDYENLPKCSWSPFSNEEVMVRLRNDLPGINVFDRVIKGRSGQILKLGGCESVYLVIKGLADPRQWRGS